MTTVHPLGPLLRQALTRSALLRAWEKVAGNRGMAGVDGEGIDDLAPKIDALCTCLAQEVIAGEYRPRPLLRIWIPRSGKSPRGLAVPVVRDRLLQTSVSLALTPTVEAVLEDSAFAYRQGRGVRQAVERIGYYQRQGYRWIVDADIEAFFDNISHSSLLAQLQALVPEPALLQLIELWLTTPIQEGSRHTTPDKGIPQGSPVSPLLANLYLDTLDDALLDAEHVLVRYADDFIVLAKTRRRAEVALDLSREVLDRLSLRLNPLKTRILHLDEGLEFLGWHFVRSFAVPKRWKEEVPTDAAVLEAPPDDDQETVDVALAQAMVEAREEAPNWQAQAPAEAAAIAPAQPAITATASPATAPADEAPQLPPLAPLLRTLYLVDHRARLAVDNARYQVERDGKVILSLPALNVDQIILFGAVQTTSQVMHLAARHDCSIAWLSYMGPLLRPLRSCPRASTCSCCKPSSPAMPTAISACRSLARVVAAKLHNSARVLARSQRHHKLALQHSGVRQRLVEIEGTLKNAASLESLRGSEGAAAALYWQAFAELVPAQWAVFPPPASSGAGRRQRPVIAWLHHSLSERCRDPGCPRAQCSPGLPACPWRQPSGVGLGFDGSLPGLRGRCYSAQALAWRSARPPGSAAKGRGAVLWERAPSDTSSVPWKTVSMWFNCTRKAAPRWICGASSITTCYHCWRPYAAVVVPIF
jgi:CRISPR-associated protein Cas1